MIDLKCEWLETNGAGGFACGCLDGALRRFWHGLLWVAKHPPTNRVRLIAGVEERLLDNDGANVLPLSALHEGGQWRAPGLEPAFSPRPAPVWQWTLPDGGRLTKQIMMRRFGEATVITYLLQGGSPRRLALRFLADWPLRAEQATDLFSVISLGDHEERGVLLSSSVPLTFSGRDGDGPVTLHHEFEADCEADPVREVRWSRELLLDLRPGQPVHLILHTDRQNSADALSDVSAWLDEESARRAVLELPGLAHRPDLSNEDRNALAIAADQFIVRRHDGHFTIVAGYPWFTDWGRDTMIALPGLALATGRFAEARSILDHFLAHADGGIIPNLFPESGQEPQFNTIDATLWLFEAFFHYVRVSNDRDFLHQYWDRLGNLIRHHVNGTHQGIRVDADGLLRGGFPGSQLTWMDVKIDDEIPTPRHGKAVEIQGLWYNALQLMTYAPTDLNVPAIQTAHWRTLAERCRSAFVARFTPRNGGILADVVDRDGPGTADWTIRPNMVIPFGLTFNIIPERLRGDVLRVAHRTLLTPRGLRTLDPQDPRYRGTYCGDRIGRDRIYHNGTAWFWLLGPFLRGAVRETRFAPDVVARVPHIQSEMLHHFRAEACLGSVSEITDGDPPHTPRGCFAQAWSVASLIESLNWQVAPAVQAPRKPF